MDHNDIKRPTAEYLMLLNKNWTKLANLDLSLWCRCKNLASPLGEIGIDTNTPIFKLNALHLISATPIPGLGPPSC